MQGRSLSVVFLVPIAVGAACTDSVAPDSTNCTAGKCDGDSSTAYDPIDVGELVRCWIVPNQPSAHITQDGQPVTVDQLVCQRNPTGSPVIAKDVQLNLTGSMAPQQASLMAPVGQSEVALEIAPQWAPYPLDLELTVIVDASEPTLSSELGLAAVAKHFTLSGPTDATADAPFRVDHPFTLWPVTVTCALTTCIVVTNDDSVPLANLTATDLSTGASGTSLSVHGVSLDPLANGASAKLHVIAPSAGSPFSAPATAYLIDDPSKQPPPTSFAIDGPAEYLASATGVAKQPH